LIGDWGLGIGDWGLGIGPNPQSPIPILYIITIYLNYFEIIKNKLKVKLNNYFKKNIFTFKMQKYQKN